MPTQDIHVLIIGEISNMEHDHVNGCQFANMFLIFTQLSTCTATENSFQIIYYTLRYISYSAHNAERLDIFLDTLLFECIL